MSSAVSALREQLDDLWARLERLDRVEKEGQARIFCLEKKLNKILREAVAIVYLNDSADYLPALWSIIRMINPAVAELLEVDEEAAYKKVCEDGGS